jgi:hypothetical protein
MKKAISNQKSIRFVWCPKPVAITASWGPQEAPDGAFLKLQDDFITVSHLVQPNADKTAPVGWKPMVEPSVGVIPGFFDKNDIWVVTDEGDKFKKSNRLLILNNQEFKLKNLDGDMTYNITEPSVIVCNDNNGEPNMDDAWVIKLAEFEKNYTI